MRKLIVGLLMIPATICLSEPLTHTEAAAWIRAECAAAGAARVTECEPLLELVIRYDLVEHELPTVTVPTPLAVLTDDGTLYLSWPEPILIDVAGVFQWAVDLAPAQFDGFHVEEIWPLLVVGGGAVAVGFIAGVLLE